MLDLIIKNGLCYIDGNLKKQDIGIKNSKITKIGTPQEVFPELVNKQRDIGVRIPQVTEFANLAPNKFQGNYPVTLAQAKERYIK